MSRYAVDPIWPLLALMLGNNAIGLAWFAFNTVALGTPAKTREYAYIAVSLAGSAAIFAALLAIHNAGFLHGSELRYAALSLTALKLCMAYALYLQQHRSFEIWEYYGGKAANGLPVLILAYLAARGLAHMGMMPIMVAAVVQ